MAQSSGRRTHMQVLKFVRGDALRAVRGLFLRTTAAGAVRTTAAGAVRTTAAGAVALLLATFSQASSAQALQPDRDPWEGINRPLYAFNQVFDGYIVKP